MFWNILLNYYTIFFLFLLLMPFQFSVQHDGREQAVTIAPSRYELITS